MTIRSDADFKAALNKLPTPDQRRVAARFVESVVALCHDPRVAAAINAARRLDISDAELTAAFHAVKTACVDSYTQCGHEADWRAQAGHFVAKAAETCVMPDGRARDIGWNAAMQARMARTCEAISTGRGTENREAEQQFRILEEFMKR
ncbi:MAG: hypothetical protein WB402_12395 [Sulfuricaulis sp.]|uniref:hypothetical protein n=1 Tax=Sulfuricaulis sp. TaxID=2003553 RepID=UPI003C487C82